MWKRFGLPMSLLVLGLVTVTGPWVACGGGDEGAGMNAAGAGGTAGGSTGATGGGGAGTGGTGTGGSANLPSTCQAPGGCPSGYVCVPNNPPKLVDKVDASCVALCSPPCDMAGPLKDMCLTACQQSCTRQELDPSSDLTGTCRADTAAGGTGGTVVVPLGGMGGGGTAGAGGSGVAFDWNATWSAELVYSAKCSWASSAMQMRDHKHSVTLKISSSGDSSQGEVSGGYALEGPKGSDTLTLSGALPLRSHNSGVASPHSLNSPNELTLKFTSTEGTKKASGTLEGSWEASGGWKCTVANGTIVITK